MDGSSLTLALAVKDAAARRSYTDWAKAASGVTLVRAADGPVDLLVFEPGTNPVGDLSRLEALLAEGRVGAAALACADPSPELLVAAMRVGIKEVLPIPADEAAFRDSLDRLRRRAPSPAGTAEGRGGRVTAVFGGKAGCGTTTFAVNLAVELNRMHPGRTVLLDLGRPLGETPIFLDLEYSYTWADVAENLSRLDAMYLDSVLARHGSGLAVLPSAGGLTADPELVDPLLAQMRASFGQVIVDGGGIHDDLTAAVAQAADLVVLVVGPSLPSLAGGRRFLEMVRGRQTVPENRLRLVLMRQGVSAEIGPDEAAEILGRKVSWSVPDDPVRTLSAINQGRPLSDLAPRSPAARAMARAALDLADRPLLPHDPHGFSLAALVRRMRAPAASAV